MSWKYTVHHGKKYRAKISLNFLESFGTNEQVAEQFTNIGFIGVEVYGSDFNRVAEGTWNGPDQTVTVTDHHILAVEEITEHKASASARQVFQESAPKEERPRHVFERPIEEPYLPEEPEPVDPNQPYLEEPFSEEEEERR